jgi:hypothetical protein
MERCNPGRFGAVESLIVVLFVHFAHKHAKFLDPIDDTMLLFTCFEDMIAGVHTRRMR